MSGLNYGYSYRGKASKYNNKTVGVSYVEKIKKWIVRVKRNGTMQVTTIASFETKEEAEKFYLNC